MSLSTTFTPSSTGEELVKIIEDPYFKVRIDSKDLNDKIVIHPGEWTKSGTSAGSMANSWSGVWPVVGFTSPGSYSVNLSRTVTLPKSGYYLITAMCIWYPSYTNILTFYDGSTPIGDPIIQQDRYQHSGWVQFKPRWFKGGSHTFNVTMSGYGWMGFVVIYPLTRYEGDNRGNNYPSPQRLDIKNASFTQNGVNELNQCNLTVAMKENYWVSEESDNLLNIKFMDHLTLWLGESGKKAKAMFGGYVGSSEIVPSSYSLNITGVDRLFDLKRHTTTQTFNIGTGTGGFPSVYELGRYLATAALSFIPCSGVPYVFGFYKDFGVPSDFNSITALNWLIAEETGVSAYGNPLPSLRVQKTTSTSVGKCVLYTDSANPYDAYEYPILNIGYYYTSGSTTPYPFNIIITVNGTEYGLHFSESTPPNNLIDLPVGKGGSWQSINVNLVELLEYGGASGDNLYVTEIRMQGIASTSASGFVYIDQIMAYHSQSQAMTYSSTDMNNFYDVLNDLCTKSNHIAYVLPGDSRSEDIMVILPQNSITSGGTIDESNNLIEISNIKTDPIGDNMVNYLGGGWTDASSTPQTTYGINFESVHNYGPGPISRIDSVEDAKNSTTALKYVNDILNSNSIPQVGFSAKVRGVPDLTPLQFVDCNIPKWRLVGEYPVKTIAYNIDLEGNPVTTTQIDLGVPGFAWKNWIRGIRGSVSTLNNRTFGIGSRTIGY